MKVSRWLGGSAIVLMAGLCVAPTLLNRSIRLSASQIQATVAAKFPVEKKDLLYTAQFSNPVVGIDSASNEVSIGVNSSVKVLGTTALTGQLMGKGALRYDVDSGELFLDSPKVDISAFNLTGLPNRYQKPAGQAISAGLVEYLKRTPIYRLSDYDAKSFITRRTLKSVHVENGLLVIELGV